MERIEIVDLKDIGIENPSPFLDGPAEFLVKKVVAEIKKVPQFVQLFDEFIDNYERMDYGINNLPAMRFYLNPYTKEAESWFINGDMMCDLIYPPNLRRNSLTQVGSTVSAALLQQFRRPSFFNAVATEVPGLNELGKVFAVDPNLQFEWGENIAPMTQITINFRLDLRAWDLWLEGQDRTKDDPFEKTLGNLTRIASQIRGVLDSGVTDPIIESNQKPGGS